jgi:CheY-like chemotaxis protein
MADAIKRATARKFDLYILDYHLPDGTGLELCLMLRTFDRDTPILFVTATSSIEESQAITAGAQGLIKKGETSFMDDLLVKVSHLLKA